MAERYFKILTVITIFAVNAVKSDDTIAALKKILKDLNNPVENNNDVIIPKQYYHPHHYKYGKSKHGNSPNLMNVQTMNLFLKPNKRQLEEIEVNRLLRTNSNDEDTCEAGDTRCGCTGTRCGSNRKDQLADEVDRIVDVINNQLNKDDDELRVNDVNRVIVDDELGKRDVDNEEDRSVYRYISDQDRDRDGKDVDRIKLVDRDYEDVQIDNERNNDDPDDFQRDMSLDERERAYKNEDFFKSKRIKVNDNIDLVILDKSDLDTLLRNQDIVDFTRNNEDKDDEDKEIFEKILAQFKKFVDSEKKSGAFRSADVITPETFFELYEPVKHQVTKKLKNYVKNKKMFTSFNMKHLTPNQKNKIRSLKMKYRRGELEDSAIEDEIVKIMFGNESKMKIVAHAENNNHIFVPKWLYDKVLSSQKTLSNSLRSRILPLTVQQKERLYNKATNNNVQKPIRNLVWRKKLGQDIKRFGIPFELEAHGLGQVAP